MRTNKLSIIFTIALLFSLSGCELVVGGWLMQGAPGVLTESAGQADDKRIRGLTTSSLVSVEGSGWIIGRKPPFTPYTFSASYSDGHSGLVLRAMVLNGPTGGSVDGTLLVEFALSNDARWKVRWGPKDNWMKEVSTIHTKQVTYIASDLAVKPIKAISCPRWPDPIPDNSESIDVKAGGSQCFRLVFPVDMPFGDHPISLTVSGITLGGKELPDVKLNFSRIPK